MSALAKSILLFLLNWFDAQLTLFWVHSRVATEGNSLLAPILSAGDAPFLFVKLGVGAFAAYILYRCAHLPLARHGMQVVLAIYLAIMIAHVATGMAALGWSQPVAMIDFVSSLPSTVLPIRF